MKGRKPSATKLALLRGPAEVEATKKPRAARPKAKPKIPPPPIPLEGDALRVYADLGEKLFTKGIIVDTDLLLFAVLCATAGQFLDASSHLAEEGPTITSDAGGNKLSGWLSIQREARRFLASLGSEFALTPIGRLRADAASNPVGDDLDDFLKQAKA